MLSSVNYWPRMGEFIVGVGRGSDFRLALGSHCNNFFLISSSAFGHCVIGLIQGLIVVYFVFWCVSCAVDYYCFNR